MDSLDDHEDHQHDSRSTADDDVALRTPPKRKGFLTRRKDVVHGVRAVLADSGCSHAYIVSKRGYQSGAHEAAVKSPVELLTWEQFQDLFYDRWLDAQCKDLAEAASDLRNYCDPLEDFIGEQLDSAPEAKRRRYVELVGAWGEAGLLGEESVLRSRIAAHDLATPAGEAKDAWMYVAILKQQIARGLSVFDEFFGVAWRYRV